MPRKQPRRAADDDDVTYTIVVPPDFSRSDTLSWLLFASHHAPDLIEERLLLALVGLLIDDGKCEVYAMADDPNMAALFRAMSELHRFGWLERGAHRHQLYLSFEAMRRINALVSFNPAGVA